MFARRASMSPIVQGPLLYAIRLGFRSRLISIKEWAGLLQRRVKVGLLFEATVATEELVAEFLRTWRFVIDQTRLEIQTRVRPIALVPVPISHSPPL